MSQAHHRSARSARRFSLLLLAVIALFVAVLPTAEASAARGERQGKSEQKGGGESQMHRSEQPAPETTENESVVDYDDPWSAFSTFWDSSSWDEHSGGLWDIFPSTWELASQDSANPNLQMDFDDFTPELFGMWFMQWQGCSVEFWIANTTDSAVNAGTNFTVSWGVDEMFSNNTANTGGSTLAATVFEPGDAVHVWAGPFTTMGTAWIEFGPWGSDLPDELWAQVPGECIESPIDLRVATSWVDPSTCEMRVEAYVDETPGAFNPGGTSIAATVDVIATDGLMNSYSFANTWNETTGDGDVLILTSADFGSPNGYPFSSYDLHVDPDNLVDEYNEYNNPSTSWHAGFPVWSGCVDPDVDLNAVDDDDGADDPVDDAPLDGDPVSVGSDSAFDVFLEYKLSEFNGECVLLVVYGATADWNYTGPIQHSFNLRIDDNDSNAYLDVLENTGTTLELIPADDPEVHASFAPSNTTWPGNATSLTVSLIPLDADYVEDDMSNNSFDVDMTAECPEIIPQRPTSKSPVSIAGAKGDR